MEPDKMALCQQQPKATWAGKWIWVPQSTGYAFRNSYAFFRKRFQAEGTVRIELAADTRYELFVDGTRVARGTMPSVSAYTSFDTHFVDVPSGEHVAAILVHHVGQTCATVMESRPGLLVEIHGSVTTVGTDSTWKCMPATCFRQGIPRMMSHFGFPQECDFRQWPEKWADPGFGDMEWLDAEVIGEAGCEPWIRLIQRDIPLLESRFVEAKLIATGTWLAATGATTATPASIADLMAARSRKPSGSFPVRLPLELGAHGNGYAVLDFSREVTGHVQLRIQGAAEGCQVELGYDETLDPKAVPNPRRTGEFADGFTLRAGQRELEVTEARGFRYLLVDVHAGCGGMVLEGARIDERTYPIRSTGSFRCSDPALDALYHTALTTTRLCMLDTYVDCPSRERVLWMDSYLQGLCSCWGMGVTALWRRALYLFAQNRCATGRLAGAIKAYAPSDNEPVIQTYLMYYVCSLSDYVRLTGDTLTGQALFSVAMDQFRVLEPYATVDGLLDGNWPSWKFSDWSAMDDSGVSGAVNAVFLIMHRKAASLARTLSRPGVARELDSRASEIAQAFRRAFWAPDEGLYVDALHDGVQGAVRSQLTNALALWAGISKGEEAGGIMGRITDPARMLPLTPGDFRLRPGFMPQCGGIVPIGTPALATVLVRALFELGMDREALVYLIRAWSGIAENGTFAEHFGMDANSSYCHGWSASPAFLLPRYVLGIVPRQPGWKSISIEPHPGDLEWAEGSVPTPNGDIHVRWSRSAGALRVDTDAPRGVVVRSRHR